MNLLASGKAHTHGEQGLINQAGKGLDCLSGLHWGELNV
jgi:hypothetical protein